MQFFSFIEKEHWRTSVLRSLIGRTVHLKLSKLQNCTLSHWTKTVSSRANRKSLGQSKRPFHVVLETVVFQSTTSLY